MMKVLCIVGHYLPGFKAGGPIRSMANIIDWLGDEFEFYVLTRDRDLGDKQGYASLESDTWHSLAKSEVLYLSPRGVTTLSLQEVLNNIDYDLLYLNGFFSPLTTKILLLRMLHLIPNRPVVLAPRGEFSKGALAVKSLKKRVYIHCVRFAGLYRNIVWQASSDYEKQDILSIFDRDIEDGKSSIHVAPNLPPKLTSAGEALLENRVTKRIGSAKIVFLSRITRNKNLTYALNCLKDMRGEVQFDIYGPIEDATYWLECQEIILTLPPGVKVSHHGSVNFDEVADILGSYHLLFFPTWGENFGHVILEALSVGCPVLISDQTPWRNLITQKAGWDLSLEDIRGFQQVLEYLISINQNEWKVWSAGALNAAKNYSDNPAIVEANRCLFSSVLTTRKSH